MYCKHLCDENMGHSPVFHDFNSISQKEVHGPAAIDDNTFTFRITLVYPGYWNIGGRGMMIISIFTVLLPMDPAWHQDRPDETQMKMIYEPFWNGTLR